MKQILLGFGIAVVLFAMFLGYHQVKRTQELTAASATYLFSETEVRDKDGKPLSRADLIDLLLKEAIAKAKK